MLCVNTFCPSALLAIKITARRHRVALYNLTSGTEEAEMNSLVRPDYLELLVSRVERSGRLFREG